MHPRLRYFGGVFIRSQARRRADRFMQMVEQPRAVQRQVLVDLLALNADSEFSRTHRLGEVRTVEDFRQRMPITDYEYFRPAINRVRNGETQALLGRRNRLLMFALTSGTTSESKYIPITRQFLDDYRHGWKVWGIRAFDDHPRLHLSDIFQLSSDHDQYRTPGGHPCGNISGLVSAMQSPLLKSMYAVPDLVAKIREADAKYYTALRLGLANPNVGLLMTANPSTLVHLASQAQRWGEELIRDIANGGLSDRFEIPEFVRRGLRGRLRRQPQRAAELERIWKQTGRLAPRDVWPQLSLLAVWTGGSAAAYLSSLRDWYGDTPIRDHGLSASEGRMTVPFNDERATGVLDVGTHFFEFIPEEEIDSSHPTVLESHELVPGGKYYILLTTSSGLYRYNIRDVVHCTGMLGRTPQVEFLNKGSHMASITGEKLSESQVVAAVCEAQQRLQIRLRFFTIAPVWGNPPGYRLLVEQGDLPVPEMCQQLAEVTDRQLQWENCEYRDKRASGRLAELAVTVVSEGSWQRFSRQRQSRLGGSVEQYKHPCLVGDLEFHGNFLRDFSTPEEIEPDREEEAAPWRRAAS